MGRERETGPIRPSHSHSRREPYSTASSHRRRSGPSKPSLLPAVAGLSSSSPPAPAPAAARAAVSSTSSHIQERLGQVAASSCLSAPRPKKECERETDEHRIEQRRKQIQKGRNTRGYDRYIAEVPRHTRTSDQPKTPDIYMKASKRRFEGLVKVWRRKLHEWDPSDEGDDESQDDFNEEELRALGGALTVEVPPSAATSRQDDVDEASRDSFADELQRILQEPCDLV